jgi:hypothetical protein
MIYQILELSTTSIQNSIIVFIMIIVLTYSVCIVIDCIVDNVIKVIGCFKKK